MKVRFYAITLLLYYKKDSRTVFPGKFSRIFKKTFPFEHLRVDASEFIFNTLNLSKYTKVSFLLTFFYSKKKK